jgi:hypothetical protein
MHLPMHVANPNLSLGGVGVGHVPVRHAQGYTAPGHFLVVVQPGGRAGQVRDDRHSVKSLGSLRVKDNQQDNSTVCCSEQTKR